MNHPTALNVTLRYVGRFGFEKPYELLQEAFHNTSDPLSSEYLQQAPGGYVSFTNAACLIMTNSTKDEWVMYDHQEIWNRIVTWKLPLITLLFQLPRPPFPFRWWTNTTVFLMMHLIGNPISTIASLLVTLHGCRQRARGLRQHIARIQKALLKDRQLEKAKHLRQKTETLWRRLAIIQVSYDEWGVEYHTYEFLKMSLNRLYLGDTWDVQFAAVLRQFEVAADLLAADRSTYILPIFIAQLVFVMSIGAAYWRIHGVSPQLGSWTNVEAYSIAMSAPFLYLIPAVFLGAVIGVSQTERSVPRVLNDLWTKLEKEGWTGLPQDGRSGTASSDSNSIEDKPDSGIPRVDVSDPANIFHRMFHGGMYSWRPDLLLPGRLSSTWPLVLLATLIVVLSVLVAGWISFRVPPEGFDCRNAGQASMLGVWLLSVGLDFVLTTVMTRLGYDAKNSGYWYEMAFFKDLAMASSVITAILMTQFGIFNRCDCFTLWGKVPLALPEIPQVAEALRGRIAFEWPAVTFGWIGVEMVFCAVIWGVYRDAFHVYNQEDGMEKEMEID